VTDSAPATTFLFSDIEGSTRLWEQEPQRMQLALARHDAMSRAAVECNRGTVVKMTGDGVHAAFADPVDALLAMLEMQQALAQADAQSGLTLRLRCGLHLGIDQRRDGDFFGRAVNRAARIMSAAHGGQMLLSQAVAVRVDGRLPASVSLRDLGAVRLRDLESPERIYQVVHEKLRADFPALRSLEATPNNLSQHLNSFVGREHELAATRKLLAASRLLTLLGVGGIGKSRLSTQLAAEVLDDYPDGVWFVELAPLTDPAMVAQAVASVLGVVEDAGRPIVEALVKFVRDRNLLVVLDNCEHLVHACADLAKKLLQAGARLRIVASSRTYLQIAGETTYQVPTLSAPDPKRESRPEELAEHEAVRLFVDRASSLQPSFRLNAQNAAAIADICHRLDGIPLAIELAAARTRALSVEAIAARLNDRFRLLVTGDQTVLPRQRTLRALIDWSYDLLTAPERELLLRLSVFAGGWTLEGAEAVGAGDGTTPADVLDPLTQLVEKSLVVMEAGGERYRLLDTVRHYAQEKVAGAGGEAPARARHLDFYLRFAEGARPELFGPQQAVWLARFDKERENFLTAHAWCDRVDDGGDAGLRLAHAVAPYWGSRGLLSLGHRLTIEALARPAAREATIARSRALFGAGMFCVLMGRNEEALGHLEESLAIARKLGDEQRIAQVLQPLARVMQEQGNLVVARSYCEEALALARRLGNKREVTSAINTLAQICRVEGELASAQELYEEVVLLARELDDRESIAIGLLNLAMVSIGSNETDQARLQLLEALTIARELGSVPAEKSVLEVAAGLGAQLGDFERAALLYGAAEAAGRQTGLRRDSADEAFLAPLIARAKDKMGSVAFMAVAERPTRPSFEDDIAEVERWLARKA